MGICLRDEKRYGTFKANSSIGEVKIQISISGFGECITLTPYKGGLIFGMYEISVDTLDDDDSDYYETEDKIFIFGIEVDKPFIRCLKRFKRR